VERRILLLIQHDLHGANAVAKVNKEQVAEIAATVHPSHQNHGFAGIAGAQSSAHMTALQTAKKV
jgi:hypothetical protein